MNELFGVPMSYIALGCVALTAGIFVFMAVIALRNPVMFKNGLRNIPRRKAQTVLIVVGLMLSTVIITAAFGTGDTLTNSVTAEVYTILGPADEFIEYNAKDVPAPEEQQVVPVSVVDDLKRRFAGDPDIRAFLPAVVEHMPVANTRTRLNEANPRIMATRPDDARSFGGLRDTGGNDVVLGAGDIAVNEDLADKIDAKAGDQVLVFYKGQGVPLTVKAVVPNSILGGTNNSFAREGAAVNFEFLSGLLQRAGSANFVAVTNAGSVHGGVDHSDAATAKLSQALRGTPYKVNASKKDNLQQAELVGNAFTTLFVVIGLFSIAAGVLLIFLIFVMLAAERKPEMGMARAVGAKRRQIVESFLAEGMGYDLGAALVGLAAGIGVAAAMVAFVRFIAGEQLGLHLEFTVSARSLVVSFCLGVITTFIVIFMASWRASRLNIVAAIRDLPESSPPNPEAATLRGYLRATLNGFVAFGYLVVAIVGALHFREYLPVFAVLALCGIPGMWLAMLRGHNFGAPASERKAGESAPAWPLVLGIVTLPVGVGAVIIVGYLLALLLVWMTRDRKPTSMSSWLIVAGIVVAPLGLVLAALQDRVTRVAWSAGIGMVGLAAGIIGVEWGIDAQKMALFAGGASLIALWAAMTLRYFHIRERLTFTVTSGALLVLWYALPGGRLEWLVGKLNAGIEMFFLSGAVMVTSGTFIVVYNADVILPLIATLGSRFGRIVPAVKTAVAYPLTSRFRTGMTIAMIGLIMFVLSMQSALNTNFSKAFSGDSARGGFDVRLAVNANNRTDDVLGSLQAGGVDTSTITAVGEVRFASPLEAQIEDPAAKKAADQFKRYTVMGVDRGFIEAGRIELKYRAAGYADDRSVWEALANDPSLAVIPASLTSGEGGFGPPDDGDLLQLEQRYTSAGFVPFTLNLRDPGTRNITRVTVIGQMKDAARTFWPGIIVQKGTVLSAFPDSKGQQFFLTLQPGTDAGDYAKKVEAGLVQASGDSLRQVIDDNLAISRGFLNMFQGFLALGLLVGIAALGVISFRAVVERRQQIGMLRAIGYTRAMVQLSFLLESGFIALSGILLGLVLGLTFAWNLFVSGEVGDAATGIPFTVPWAQVGVVTGFAFVMSLVMTYLPARQASRVAIAEALRYE